MAVDAKAAAHTSIMKMKAEMNQMRNHANLYSPGGDSPLFIKDRNEFHTPLGLSLNSVLDMQHWDACLINGTVKYILIFFQYCRKTLFISESIKTKYLVRLEL